MYSTIMSKFIENISEKLVRIVINPSVIFTSFYVEHPVVIRVHRWLITASHNFCVYFIVQCDKFRLNI